MVKVSSCLVILIVFVLSVAYSSSEYINMGILHTVQRFTVWHAKEESLSTELKVRLGFLKLEMKLLQRSIKLYSKVTEMFLLELSFHRMVLNAQQLIIEELLNIWESKNWIGFEDLFFSMMAWVHFTEVNMLSPKKVCASCK